MSMSFEKPVGSVADVRELEYISALHQTDPECVRMDGSINDSDIANFLCSRYGIVVTTEDVRKVILHGLGGGDSDEECIDLMEIVAILLIPTLLKANKVEVEGETLNEEMVKPTEGLIQSVLNMILEDVTGDSKPKQLTKDLLVKIFESYGERELADDDEILQEMIEAVGGEQPLDIKTFARALTYDVGLYDLQGELRTLSHFEDIMMKKGGKEIDDEELEDTGFGLSAEEITRRKAMAVDLETKFTAPAMDSATGSYKSKFLIVALWVSYMLFYISQWDISGNFEDDSANSTSVGCEDTVPYEFSNSPWRDNGDAVGCEVKDSIGNWLIRFLGFSFLGALFVGCGSRGNGIEDRRICGTCWGVCVVIGYFAAVIVFWAFSEDSAGTYLTVVTMIFMSIVIILQCLNMCAICLKPERIERINCLKQGLKIAQMQDFKDLKSASQNKISLMTENALKLNLEKDREGVLTSHYGQGLQNFAAIGDETELTGGFVWAWKSILNNAASKEYGIWFYDRLIASNIAQYIITLFVLLSGIVLTSRLKDNFDPEIANEVVLDYTENIFDLTVNSGVLESFLANFSGVLAQFVATGPINCTEYQSYSDLVLTYGSTFLDEANIDSSTVDINDAAAGLDYLCSFAEVASNDTLSSAVGLQGQLALLNSSGMDIETLRQTVLSTVDTASSSTIESLYPAEQYMITIPSGFGTMVAFLVCITWAVTFLPSVAATILKLRCGVIPTLQDKNFVNFRKRMDLVTLLLGSLFWGTLFSSLLVGGLVGGIIFLCLWQASAVFVQKMIAIIIGVLVILILKIVIFSLLSTKLYNAFYRTRPFSANVLMTVLDWANFPLSVGFVTARIIKLLLAAFLFVGKIDAPLLAPHAAFLDKIPNIFLQDVLLHEAHRHPYIEQLGVTYLMKLRYRNDFGKRAGSAWRLMFVFALMPWMSRYRILEQTQLDLERPNKELVGRSPPPRKRKDLPSSESSESSEVDMADPKKIRDEEYLRKPAEEQNFILENEINDLHDKIRTLQEALKKSKKKAKSKSENGDGAGKKKKKKKKQEQASKEP